MIIQKFQTFFDGFVKEVYCKSLWKLSLWEGDFSSDANSWDNKQGSSCTTGCNKGAPVVTHTQTITHTHTKGTPHTFIFVHLHVVRSLLSLEYKQDTATTGGASKTPGQECLIWPQWEMGKWKSQLVELWKTPSGDDMNLLNIALRLDCFWVSSSKNTAPIYSIG